MKFFWHEKLKYSEKFLPSLLSLRCCVTARSSFACYLNLNFMRKEENYLLARGALEGGWGERKTRANTRHESQ